MKWTSVEKRTPITYMTGVWDGKMSDNVLVSNLKGDIRIASLTEGFMDGSEFKDWYEPDGYEIKDVAYWLPLPDFP